MHGKLDLRLDDLRVRTFQVVLEEAEEGTVHALCDACSMCSECSNCTNCTNCSECSACSGCTGTCLSNTYFPDCMPCSDCSAWTTGPDGCCWMTWY